MSAKRGKSAKPAGAKSDQGDVGKTLRSVYHQTVNEAVPSELLDLLGKLS